MASCWLQRGTSALKRLSSYRLLVILPNQSIYSFKKQNVIIIHTKYNITLYTCIKSLISKYLKSEKVTKKLGIHKKNLLNLLLVIWCVFMLFPISSYFLFRSLLLSYGLKLWNFIRITSSLPLTLELLENLYWFLSF